MLELKKVTYSAEEQAHICLPCGDCSPYHWCWPYWWCWPMIVS